MFEKDFLLNSKTAKNLYSHAEKSPIYDYHCHLNPKEIRENKVFTNITDVWLGFDHYKWRVMRYAGVEERLITGDGEPYDKFLAFAKTIEKLIGSPLYHWTHLELKKYFGIEKFITSKNTKEIYDEINTKIEKDQLTPVKFITDSNVKLICTTDDPIDNLSEHVKIKEKNYPFQVLPTFRPDRALKILDPEFKSYIRSLGQAADIQITTYDDLKTALVARISYFKENGALLSDHSLESLLDTMGEANEADKIFQKALLDEPISEREMEIYKNQTLVFLAKEYKKQNLTMQLHIGAMRNNNTKMFHQVGVDAGFDIMNDFRVAQPMSILLDEMDKTDGLPKTVIYNLNANDNQVLSALPHCFPEDGVPGKLQFGTPWWFIDHKKGMENHFEDIGNQGMIGNFIGMLTDSRSFLSYARHDYFRRILCNYVGTLVEKKEFNDDPEILHEIIDGVTHKNIQKYLGVDL